MEKTAMEKQKSSDNRRDVFHTTIALQKDTKKKLDDCRATGQCYDGFINDLVTYWEKYKIGGSLCSQGKDVCKKE
jgi:hypothetical protein